MLAGSSVVAVVVDSCCFATTITQQVEEVGGRMMSTEVVVIYIAREEAMMLRPGISRRARGIGMGRGGEDCCSQASLSSLNAVSVWTVNTPILGFRHSPLPAYIGRALFHLRLLLLATPFHFAMQ